MFTYVFHNPLFLGQYRKIALSFPLPMTWRHELKLEGWEELTTKDEWLEDYK